MSETVEDQLIDFVEEVDLSESEAVDLLKNRNELESLDPAEGVEMYIKNKKDDVRSATINSYRSRLELFVKWCQANNISNLNNISGRTIQEYRQSRREGGISESTMETQLNTLSNFFAWCESIEAVSSGLSVKTKHIAPDLNTQSKKKILRSENARKVISYLNTYQHASNDHVIWQVLGGTGMRSGSLRALDKQDYTSRAESDGEPYLELYDRPETGTPLKNGDSSERQVKISPTTDQLLDTYLNNPNHDEQNVHDEYDRKPLLVTKYGRMSASTIRKCVYRWSRKCKTSGMCPVDGVDEETCAYAKDGEKASKCPVSRSPHPIRRGYITYELIDDIPADVVSERCDVSTEVINEHYDDRTKEEKRKQRTRRIEQARDTTETYI